MVAGVVALVVAAPLITGDVEVFVLNLVGLGIGALLLRGFLARAHGSEVPPLTASGRSQPIPTRKGRLFRVGPSSLPARAQSKGNTPRRRS